jgi:hydroxymethylpyrimidine pyrophosphatase-like HAD family hydrolase
LRDQRYQLLAVDVDGTLLRRDGGIHPGDLAAVARLRAAGVPVTIATGRLYSGTRFVAERLRLTGPIACVDGSHIVDLRDHRALVLHSIAGASAAALRDVVLRHRIVGFLFAQDGIVHDAAGEPFAGYVRTWSPRVDVVARVADHPAWEHADGLLALVGIGVEADARLDHAARVITFPIARGDRRGMHAMVVRAAGPTKGTAIAWLAAHHGCTPAEVVVVGDWINDVPMFMAAGRSFAMGQAPAHVKAAATDHLEADSLDGGGVAEAIRRAFGV